MVTGAAHPAAEAAGVRAAPARPAGCWPLVGGPPGRYRDRTRRYRATRCPRPRLAARRSALPPGWAAV